MTGFDPADEGGAWRVRVFRAGFCG